jgi:hypothetical protein
MPLHLLPQFGPTEWESEEGYDVPKTLLVTGLCNANPFETDESNWSWEECSEDIPFDDLWFAVRGGGGGWGVVTSMYLQLHEYLPYERIIMKYSACVADKLDESQAQAWDLFSQAFEIKFLLDPTSINATEQESNACGWPTAEFSFSCFGEGSAAKFNDLWKDYLSANRQSLEDAEISPEIIDEAINCGFDVVDNGDYDSLLTIALTSANTTIMTFKEYLDSVVISDDAEYYPGLGRDLMQPGYAPGNVDSMNVLVPAKWILENIDLAAVDVPPNPFSYRAFGGKASSASSDQMNSLSGE